MAKKATEAVRRVIAGYFQQYARHHLEWLRGLTERYKQKGDFPLLPMRLIAEFYEDGRDREIAAIAGLMITDDERSSEHVRQMVSLMGSSPWQWFEGREFVTLSIGSRQHGRTGGVVNWRLARLMDRLWLMRRWAAKDGEGNPVTVIQPMGEAVSRLHLSYFDALRRCCEDCGLRDIESRLRLLLLILGGSDGFGLRLWSVSPRELKSPLTDDLLRFLRLWLPDAGRLHDYDEAIRLFQMPTEADFFYAFLAYSELSARKPRECQHYATQYLCAYESGAHLKPFNWRRMQEPLNENENDNENNG